MNTQVNGLAVSAVWMCAAIVGLLSCIATGQAEDEVVKGVNPKDNIRKAELLCKYDDFEQDKSIASCTPKFDVALNKNWGANIEVPIISFSGFGLEEHGIGDINLRLRYATTIGAISYIAGAELVLPTASDEFLGLGEYQLNAVAGIVVPLSPQVFVYAGYKHFFELTDDNEFIDINDSQFRLLAAYTSVHGWWMLGDVKYTKSWAGEELESLDTEAEAGRMLDASTGLFGRVGTSFLDNTREYGINLGIRRIF